MAPPNNCMTDQTPTTLPDTADLKAAIDALREAAKMFGLLQWQVQRIARAFDANDDPEHALVDGDEIPTFAHIGELYVFVTDARDRLSECKEYVEVIADKLIDLDSVREMEAEKVGV
jgi:hypothetical protein